MTYAEAGGWGRALVLEARRRGIPSVGLQHGFIYRHWLNYRPRAGRDAAARRRPRLSPIPTARCVFDRYAAEHLRAGRALSRRRRSRSPAARGSTNWRRAYAALRPSATRSAASSASDAGSRSSVLAAKFTRDPGRAAGARRRRRARCRTCASSIKPHPAETPDVYARGRARHAERSSVAARPTRSGAPARGRRRDRDDELDGGDRRRWSSACRRSSSACRTTSVRSSRPASMIGADGAGAIRQRARGAPV